MEFLKLRKSSTLTFPTRVVGLGMHVVVGYDEDFYLGEIQIIINKNIRVIHFMERCYVKDDAYKWPQVENKAKSRSSVQTLKWQP